MMPKTTPTPSDVVPEQLFSGLIAEEYAKLHLICPAAAEMSRRVGEFMSAWAPPHMGAELHVLELGSGTGVTTQFLLSSGPDLRVTGVDNEPAMLGQARRALESAVAAGRLNLVETDALSYLQELPGASIDAVASAYTLHNFLDGYRFKVLEEVFRVLKPGGVFVNGDRYAVDDRQTHLKHLQDEVRGYFKVFNEMGRQDLLEQWIVHLFSDESELHVMRLEPALEAMGKIGFAAPSVHYRAEVNALLTGTKPW